MHMSIGACVKYVYTILYPGRGVDQRKNCAHISHVAQVIRHVSLLGLIVIEQGRVLVNTFPYCI